MIRNASQLFEKELSGEPLTQESIIEAMNMFAIEVLEEILNNLHIGYEVYQIESGLNSLIDEEIIELEDKIEELKQNLNEKI